MTDSTASASNAPPAPRRGLAAVLRALAPWILVVVGALWMLSNQRGREPMPAGEPVPALSLPLATGGTFDLESHRGKPVLLTFWASWCPACRAEAPAIQAAHEKLAAVGGTAIGLAVDRRSIPAARRLGMEFPQAVVSQSDLDRFGVELLPTTILVDPEGNVAASFVGEVRSRTLDEVLEPFVD